MPVPGDGFMEKSNNSKHVASFRQRKISSENMLVMSSVYLLLLNITGHNLPLPGEAVCWEHRGVVPPCCGDTSCRV